MRDEDRQYFSAFSRAYNLGMRYLGIRMIAEALFALAAIVISWLELSPAPWFGLISGIWLMTRRLILDGHERSLHRDAVRIQEEFDTRIFGLEWNKGLAGEAVLASDVRRYAADFSGEANEVDTWFVDTTGVPKWIAALIRQWQGAAWAKDDHRRFSILLAGGVGCLIALTVTVGLITDLTLADYLAALALPILPVILSLQEMRSRHRNQVDERGRAEALINSALIRIRVSSEADATERESRQVQDALYLSRLTGGRIPQWLYKMFREKNVRAIDAAASQLAAEFRAP
jgi:hypothetical protein